jgi:hypothetical protein
MLAVIMFFKNRLPFIKDVFSPLKSRVH